MGGREPTPAQARASLAAAIARQLEPPHIELHHNINLIATTIPYGTEQLNYHRPKPKNNI